MDPGALQQMRDDLSYLANHLRAKGVDVWIESNTAREAALDGFQLLELHQLDHQVDLAIVMGGDGTMLSIARLLMGAGLPLVGINRGRLGFLTDLRTETMLTEMDRILEGEFQLENRMMLHAALYRAEKCIHENVALNDVVIKNALRLIEIEVTVNHQFVSRQRADGIILSSPTGTTAYALSAGGPILHPDLDAISLVPISPHTLSNRPITVPSDSLCEITIVNADDAHLSYDGQQQQSLQIGDVVRISRARQDVQLLHPQHYCYFDMLRNKLNWG